MLDNAIEVSLLGELDRIHRILIANTKELNDFRTLKSLLRDAFLKHPPGGCVDIPEFDIEKTIYFEQAFDRVAELYPGLSETWKKRLVGVEKDKRDSLHALRNNIVHFGNNSEQKGRYVHCRCRVSLS